MSKNILSMKKKAITEISVVIPVYNEESCISELYVRLKQAVGGISERYEFIFVDDGSNDNTLPLIKHYASQDEHVKYITFSRNFGHQNAIIAGITYASGNCIVIIDGDLQDPPELIPKLYEKYKEGFHVVYAKRIEREGENLSKKLTAKIFYRLLKWITPLDIPVDTGDFRIISRQVAEELKKMEEKNLFLRGQIAWIGFRQTFVSYKRKSRHSGKTKFSYSKMLRFALDGVTSFSNLPLKLATFLGFVFSFVAFIIILYALYSKFILNRVVTGWTSLMLSTMFIGGVQLLCIGIIGEYISRIGNDVRKRPLFIIEETNLKDQQ